MPKAKKVAASARPLSVSPAFDPVAYEAQSPNPTTATAAGTVWEDTDIYQYVEPTQSRLVAREPTPPLQAPARSATPSPVLRPQVWAVPAGEVPPMYQLPSLGFLHHLPQHMPPNHETPFYVTPNGAVTYRAYSDANGVVHVTMSAPLAELLGMYDAIWDQQRRGV